MDTRWLDAAKSLLGGKYEAGPAARSVRRSDIVSDRRLFLVSKIL